MPWIDQLKAQGKLLKLPLIITAMVLVLFAGGAYVSHLFHAPNEPLVVEATAPAAALRDLVFFREGDEYVLYFSLYDAAGRDAARRGEARIKISQLGTIGIEGGPEFVNETVLLEGTLSIETSTYHWVDIGGGLFFNKRRLIVPIRIAADKLKRPLLSGAKGKLSVRFRDAKVPGAETLYTEKVLLFP